MTREDIKAHASAIEIPYLVHFTRTSNLQAILQHGLYPRARVGEIGVTPVVNDKYRLDGHLDATSVSIAFPNSKMLWKYKKENSTTEWAILVLNAAILWIKNCAYCKHNAADGRISSLPLDHLQTVESFRELFDDDEGGSREAQKLKRFDPTDEQSEVLVFDIIEPIYIAGVVFETATAQKTFSPYLGNRRSFVHADRKGMFATRSYTRKA